MVSKFLILILIFNLIDQFSANPIFEKINQPLSQSDSENLISSETIQQVLFKKRSSKSQIKIEVKSNLLNSIKANELVEYRTEDCELKSMKITGDELGWRNKVLAPFKFKFNYCEGKCRPIEYAPISLIVKENDSTLLRIYDDLMVSKCG